MQIKTISPIGEQVLSGGHAIILGVSLYNSYFKDENLQKLIMWASGYSTKIYIMIPDTPSIHTRVACGKTPAEARRDTHAKAQNLEIRCKRIMQMLGVSAEIIRWSILENNKMYADALANNKQLYEYKQVFRNEARETTRQVLQDKQASVPESSIDIGVRFLLEELSFIGYSPGILGVEKTAYVYHRPTHILHNMIDGVYGKQFSSVGYIVAE